MPPQNADSEAQPYRPIFAQEIELIPDWVGRTNVYLSDTSNGSLQARFHTLNLNDPLKMDAACNLLDDTNKGKVVRNTRNTAEKLVRTKKAADREQTTESANAHQKALLPHPTNVNTPENMMALCIAIFAFQLVMMREQAHSDEFELVKGQRSFDLGILVCIIFEAVLDRRNGAHKGYFVRKFSIGLASNRPSPISPSLSSDAMLPFTPKVARFLQEKANKIKLARRYLEESSLFSQITSLDLNGRAVRRFADKLLSTPKDTTTVLDEILDLMAQAETYLNKSTELSRKEDQVAQSGTLTTRLIRLAASIVSDRKKKFPKEFAGRGTIPFNILIVIALIFEIFTAHEDEGSYIHRELEAAARAAKRATTTKSALTPKSSAPSKRTIVQTNTDSANGESSNSEHDDQPVKRRKKQAKKEKASNEHDKKVFQRTRKLAKNDISEVRGTHLEEIDSDPESSLFIPQTDDSGLPAAASSDTSPEAFDKALEELQEKSVFHVGNQGPPNPHGPPPATSNVPALPTTHAPTPVPSGPRRLRSRAMRPILGQTYYDELKTDFEVVADAYNILQPEEAKKGREITSLKASVAELQSEVEVLSSVVEETSEENHQLRARVKELEQQLGKTRR
jgi:hypothetical protein